MQIVGYSIIGKTIANSEDEKVNSDYLSFLSQKKENTIRIMYDLDKCIKELAVVLRLNDYQKDILFSTSYLKLGGFILRYLPNKLLSIKHKDLIDSMSYYADSNQYFQPKLVPNDVQYEANLAKVVGMSVYKSLVELGMNPTSLPSAIRCYEKDVLSKIDFCSDEDAPEEAIKYASKCLENDFCLTVGNDINVSSNIKNLIEAISLCLDIRYGPWMKVQVRSSSCDYGFYKVKLKDGIAYLNKEALEFNYNGCKVIEGWEWYCRKRVLPYYNYVVDLYHAWEKSNGIKRKLIEDIVIGICEKMVENKSKSNTIWATQVKSSIRLKELQYV